MPEISCFWWKSQIYKLQTVNPQQNKHKEINAKAYYNEIFEN